MQPLALIAAIGQNDAIGWRGGLPWSYPEDRAHFERETRGHAVILGRRTFEERGQPLPGRRNIVVSRSLLLRPGIELAADLDEALALASATDVEPFVIGGARLFEIALPRVTRALITWIPEAPEADTFFHFDARGFELVEQRQGARGERYVEYRRA